jgi:hypothetical protein
MTYGLLGSLFGYRDLGAVEVNGGSRPVLAWQVVRPSVVASRFEAWRGSALSPLVGRHQEIDLLLRRWARARVGDGQILLVMGEPGIGKSRITAELEKCLRTEPYFGVRYFCSPHHQDSALFPFIDQLGRAARPFGRIGKAREQQMHDIFGHVVIAPGNEDLLARDALMIAFGYRPGAD